jgi:hypothetical protein
MFAASTIADITDDLQRSLEKARKDAASTPVSATSIPVATKGAPAMGSASWVVQDLHSPPMWLLPGSAQGPTASGGTTVRRVPPRQRTTRRLSWEGSSGGGAHDSQKEVAHSNRVELGVGREGFRSFEASPSQSPSTVAEGTVGSTERGFGRVGGAAERGQGMEEALAAVLEARAVASAIK